ncbi:MAG: amino acid decarboxylase [Acidobacteria bacterium]|nr:MAG: amino acid decarboxylase [Acidobacteriota bacterium]
MADDHPPYDFRAALHRAADLVADYVDGVEGYPVLPPVAPGDVAADLPPSPPATGEPYERLLEDYRRLIEPRVTHWNHPGFLAYFSSSGSEPGILGETLAAGLSVNAMLWRTAPAASELEEVVCDWLRQMIDLPPAFRGHINDTASSSTLIALAAARDRQPELAVRQRGLAGRSDLPAMVVYASEHAHSSVDKAAIALGFGLENVRRIACDEDFRLAVPALAQAIAADRAAGRLPLAVVATAGTTSTTSIDPLRPIAELCAAEDLWLHVDAAWAGSAAICPEYRALMDGLERADSIVVNPHKWLFTPMDCSVLLVRDEDALRAAFSLVPAYLHTAEQDAVRNLMDLGVQLGRRFRALKLWLVIRHFGVEGLRATIRRHCRLGQELARWIDRHPLFERLAPVPFSVVCFRATHGGGGEAGDRFNRRLLAAVNAAGPVFLSHTELGGRYVLRLAVSNLRTARRHVETAWRLLQEHAERLAAEDRP